MIMRRRPLIYALLALDLVWWILWVAFMHWFMLGSDSAVGMSYLREAFWKTTSHFFLAIALVTAWKEIGEGHVSVVAAPWLFFAIFIDLYTVYDVFHVINAHPVDGPRLQALQALSVLAVIFSGLGSLVYAIILSKQRDRQRRI